MARYTLNPAMPVLLRPDGVVQVGWDPRRAVLVRPPAGLHPGPLADLLRTLQSGATLAEPMRASRWMRLNSSRRCWTPEW